MGVLVLNSSIKAVVLWNEVWDLSGRFHQMIAAMFSQQGPGLPPPTIGPNCWYLRTYFSALEGFRSSDYHPSMNDITRELDVFGCIALISNYPAREVNTGALSPD